ncbi:DUF1622 domain-containing protein [Flavihumibacter sp. R14]|nr:DUF1622 domain-containing protein [Flavihumibacter soli]
MYELIEIIKARVFIWGEFTEIILNAISLLFIVLGVFVSIVRTLRKGNRLIGYPPHMYFRMTFGGWLVVALEFQLAADIVGTIIAPTNEQLIQLGAVAIIRTFLNYFLNRELTEQMELSRIAAEKQVQDKLIDKDHG